MLLPASSLADQSDADGQVARKHSLTGTLALPQRQDLLAGQGLHCKRSASATVVMG